MGLAFNVAQRTLYDVRDNNSYTVRKLADGNCWMTTNLALEFDGNTTLNSDTTNLAAGTTVTPGRTDGLDGTIDYDSWKAQSTPTDAEIDRWRSRTYCYRGDYCREADGSYPNLTGENQLAGLWYNWYTATAGTGTSQDAADGRTGASDICPKNWQLPGYNSTGKSWDVLIRTIYGVISSQGEQGSTTSNDILHKLPFSVPYTGVVRPSCGCNDAIGKEAWFASTYSVDNTRNGDFLIRDTHSWTQGANSKASGYTVRCVAK